MKKAKTLFSKWGIVLPVLLLLLHTAHAQTPDPGIPGSYSVVKSEYNLGDMAYKPADFPDSVEVRGSVFYPSAMTTAAAKYPVIFLLHGRHDTCYDTSSLSTSGVWPCPPGSAPITSYEGYDYLANNLTSHGYIVISVSCNSINATDNSVGDYGMQGRAELLQHHMDLWNTWTTTGGGPFASLFVGHLDMQNVGTMGHSRGGEGVVFNALYNRSLGSPYGIHAVLTLAPVDFERHVLHGIPLLNIAPYCDGDVNDLQGVHFYDDSRYSDTTDEAPKHSILFMGANHDFFNTVWTPGSYIAGGVDDWLYGFSPYDPQCGPLATGTHRFDTTTQKNALLAYAAAFYRVYIGHETEYSPILTVDDIHPPSTSTLDSSQVFVSYHPARFQRLDVNRSDSSNKLTVNSLQDSVLVGGTLTADICGGGLGMASCGISGSSAQVPHEGSYWTIGLAQTNLVWTDTTAYIDNRIPNSLEDVSAYDNLVFRTSVNFSLYSSAPNLDLTVELVDSFGAVSDVDAGAFTHALFVQPGTQSGDLPKTVFNTVSIPLGYFGAVDLTHVTDIKFKFNQTPSGALLISDLAFAKSPCNGIAASTSDSIGVAGDTVFFSSAVNAATTDFVSQLWNFGDPGSGTADTSSAANPYHYYATSGAYSACLYTTAARSSGFYCTDTVCMALTITATSALTKTIKAEKVNVFPVPTDNFVEVSGIGNDAVLTLFDMYGRTVAGPCKGRVVQIPAALPGGVYFLAIDDTELGRVVRKIEVKR